MPTIRILIADDHPIFRDGLRRLVESQPSLCLVGEAVDGAEAVALATKLKPEILLLDLAMPKLPGLEVLRQLSTAGLPTRTIVLTAALEDRQIVEALKFGARGVVLKDTASQLLAKAIHQVADGEYWIGRSGVADLIHALQAASRPDTAASFGLTARELEMVSAIVEGCSNRDIAKRFSISEQTVKNHLNSIFDKVGVSSRLELALFAVKRGLVKENT